MTETEIQAALDRARGARKIDVCFCPADVEALVTEVKRLREIRETDSTETNLLLDRTQRAEAERDQLRARVAELEPRYTGDQVIARAHQVLARARQAGFDEAIAKMRKVRADLLSDGDKGNAQDLAEWIEIVFGNDDDKPRDGGE